MRYNNYGKGNGGFKKKMLMVQISVGDSELIGEGRNDKEDRNDDE